MTDIETEIHSQPSLPKLSQNSKLILSSVGGTQVVTIPGDSVDRRSVGHLLCGAFAVSIAVIAVWASMKYFFTGALGGYALITFLFLSGMVALYG